MAMVKLGVGPGLWLARQWRRHAWRPERCPSTPQGQGSRARGPSLLPSSTTCGFLAKSNHVHCGTKAGHLPCLPGPAACWEVAALLVSSLSSSSSGWRSSGAARPPTRPGQARGKCVGWQMKERANGRAGRQLTLLRFPWTAYLSNWLGQLGGEGAAPPSPRNIKTFIKIAKNTPQGRTTQSCHKKTGQKELRLC